LPTRYVFERKNFYGFHVATERSDVLQEIIQQVVGDFTVVHHRFRRLKFAALFAPKILADETTSLNHRLSILRARFQQLRHQIETFVFAAHMRMSRAFLPYFLWPWEELASCSD